MLGIAWLRLPSLMHLSLDATQSCQVEKMDLRSVMYYHMHAIQLQSSKRHKLHFEFRISQLTVFRLIHSRPQNIP